MNSGWEGMLWRQAVVDADDDGAAYSRQWQRRKILELGGSNTPTAAVERNGEWTCSSWLCL